MAAKATALIEETVTSCDAAAYTWHSSITASLCSTWCSFKPWCSFSSAALLPPVGVPIYYLTPFYLGAASSSWNSERHCLAWCDPCLLNGCQQKTTWNSPVLWQMSENGKLRDMTFTLLQATVGILLLWPFGFTVYWMWCVFLSTGDQWPI